MKQLPKTSNPPVIRTDFGNQPRWESICKLLRAPVHESGLTFYANVDLLEESEFRNLTSEELLARVPRDYEHSFLFVVDTAAITHPEFAILVVDLESRKCRFRAVPSQIQGIGDNLSIGNMGFEEFADAVDKDGIFRGFSKP